MAWIERVFSLARILAFAAVIAMMAVTLTDIFLRTAGRWAVEVFALAVPVSVAGAVDLVEAAVVLTAFMSIPVVFFADKHVGVEALTDLMERNWRLALKAVGALLGGLFMLACTLTAWDQAQAQLSLGYRTATIGIPLRWFWIVIFAGSALSVLACLVILWRRLRSMGGEG